MLGAGRCPTIYLVIVGMQDGGGARLDDGPAPGAGRGPTNYLVLVGVKDGAGAGLDDGPTPGAGPGPAVLEALAVLALLLAGSAAAAAHSLNTKPGFNRQQLPLLRPSMVRR